MHCCVPHLHTFTSCVRQGYCIHNTASFRYTPHAPLHCIPAVSCLSPFIFSAVALFVQPSGLAPFRKKRHFALNQGTQKAVSYFFPAVTRSFSFILRFVPRQLQFSASGGCSIAATPPLRSSSRPKRTRLRCLGVFDCRFHNNAPRRTSTRRWCNFLKRKRKKSSKHSIHSSLSVGLP
ncbi:Transmembrane protein [Flavobacterium sinopsychrotolerans]|uniref:Uncharacterized protein n=1 Tax=Flavobacterium sinopsychrotolerans TaxID=604089 RepID=A0A1H8LVK7_9FLAO|nr:hypothetical protein SAMN04487942_1698 [Flavobacterium sinopsychrotolerans]